MRLVTLLPMWVISVPKRPENINTLKQLTGILKFVIRIQGQKILDRIMQCFKCQTFGHKVEFCHIKDRCVKCAGEHNTRVCTKDAAHSARCANSGGQHSANCQWCPEAQKYKERSGTTRTPSKPQLPGLNSPSCLADNKCSNQLQSSVRVVEMRIFERS